jgi:hypothetical protein
MQDKELIEKLKMLKEIRPETSWKQEARGVLLSQVSNASGAEVRFSVFENISHTFKNTFSFMPRAAWGIICLAVVLTGGTYGAYAAKYSKPGDSFYAVKILKEKVQLAVVFNKEEKAKLDMKMASNHAKEISEVLADANYKGDQKKAEQLAQNFEQEINTVKERLSEINKIQNKNSIAEAGAPSIDNSAAGASAGNNNDSKIVLGGINKETDITVHVVESGKDNRGIQVYDPKAGNMGALAAGKVPTTTSAGNASGFSGTEGVGSTSTSTIPVETMNVSDKINSTLDKATESFNTKDFSGAKDMLEQVGVIIENIGSGAVKGVAEIGSSSVGAEVSGGASGSSSENK